MQNIENHPKPNVWDYPLLGLMAGVLVAAVWAPYLIISSKLESFQNFY